jgi:AraC family transcriptional regulator of adaptative response/methylated-DNA-[protein]-cysteine methyltransferase
MSTATAAPATGLSREEMWAAFVGRDPRYDGRFVTGVRTTGIFCRPTCTCRKPRPERVEYFASPRAAERAGYRACKRCRPELAGGSLEADRRIVEQALAVMRDRIDQPLTLEALARATATSVSRLARLFRAADGRTPMRALADLRAERAERLLSGGGISVLEAALAAGFGSGSAFLRAFRRRTGRTPSAWRRSRAARVTR